MASACCEGELVGFLADELRHAVYFASQSTATALAQQVVITGYLDANLDWSTFRPREIAFGSRVMAASGESGAFSTQVDIADYRAGVDKSWSVDVSAALDSGTGRVAWTLRTLDPQTGQPPPDALAGFLPPNDATGRGEGHVTFSVGARPNVPLGTVLRNQASITFDTETTINTNVVTNTVGVRTYLPLVVKGTPMP